jgi:hypothetical protein
MPFSNFKCLVNLPGNAPSPVSRSHSNTAFTVATPKHAPIPGIQVTNRNKPLATSDIIALAQI